MEETFLLDICGRYHTVYTELCCIQVTIARLGTMNSPPDSPSLMMDDEDDAVDALSPSLNTSSVSAVRPRQDEALPASKSAKNSPAIEPSSPSLCTQDGPPPLVLPSAATTAVEKQKRPPAPVPEAPAAVDKTQLLSATDGINTDESYSIDEKQLNEFLKLHPMLSMEATNPRTLQLLSNLFKKASIKATDLPVITKSYDDMFLRPANKQIGERDCICGDHCMAKFIAQLRFGTDTKLAFTCCEFLLPDAHTNFLNGKGLPQRRSKCLLCSRYFQNYIYLLARTDPAFKIEESPLGVQVFCNVQGQPPPIESPQAKHLHDAQKELPVNASSIGGTDGYRAEAMLFVDEDFMNLRSAREGKLGTLAWKPVVRFCSRDYDYINTEDGPKIVQVGIGYEDHMDGLHFRQPSAARSGPPGASSGPTSQQ